MQGDDVFQAEKTSHEIFIGIVSALALITDCLIESKILDRDNIYKRLALVAHHTKE